MNSELKEILEEYPNIEQLTGISQKLWEVFCYSIERHGYFGDDAEKCLRQAIEQQVLIHKEN